MKTLIAASLLVLTAQAALAETQSQRSYKCVLDNYKTGISTHFEFPDKSGGTTVFAIGDGYVASVVVIDKSFLTLQIRDSQGGQVHAETSVKGFPDSIDLGCLNVSKETASLGCSAK